MNGHSSAVPPNTAVTSHKSPSSRLQFLRHLGALRKSNRDEVTIRTTDCLISSSSSVKCEETNRGNRKCASGGGGGGGASLRKTITNMFHLKPPVRSNHGGNCVVGREDDPGGGGGGDYRRKNNSSAGNFISRLTAKRHKSAVPPGKRALPPVPPPPPSNHHTVVASSRTPSPQQQLNGTVAERVPSPAAGLDAFDWVEGGGGLALDQSPELGVVAATSSTSGAASPASTQSQMDFAASIEKVKDVSIFFSVVILFY
jgi:hypothetical protein